MDLLLAAAALEIQLKNSVPAPKYFSRASVYTNSLLKRGLGISEELLLSIHIWKKLVEWLFYYLSKYESVLRR